MANGAGAEARWGFAGVEARHPDEGGRGEWFLATKNAKGTKVGGMGASAISTKGVLASLWENPLQGATRRDIGQEAT